MDNFLEEFEKMTEMHWEYPTTDILLYLNEFGLSYKEMRDKFDAIYSVEWYKKWFYRRNIKHKKKADVIREFKKNNPEYSVSAISKFFNEDIQLVIYALKVKKNDN